MTGDPASTATPRHPASSTRPHPARYRSERERPEANVDFYNILETATFKVFKNVHLGTCQRQVNGAVRNERTRDYTNSIYWY